MPGGAGGAASGGPSTQDIVDVFHSLPSLSKPSGPGALSAARRRLQRRAAAAAAAASGIVAGGSPRAGAAAAAAPGRGIARLRPVGRRRGASRGAAWGTGNPRFDTWPCLQGDGPGETPSADLLMMPRPCTVPGTSRPPAPTAATPPPPGRPQPAAGAAQAKQHPASVSPQRQPRPTPAASRAATPAARAAAAAAARPGRQRPLPPPASGQAVGWPGEAAGAPLPLSTSVTPPPQPAASPPPTPGAASSAQGGPRRAASPTETRLWYDFAEGKGLEIREDRAVTMDANRLAMMEVQHRKKSAPQPGVLVDMERFVHSELATLNARLGAHPSSEALASYADARMSVFRECARFFVRHFRTYGVMLGRIFREYEHYVRRAREAMARARELVRDAAGSRDAQADLYLRLREEFEQYDAAHREQLEGLYRRHQEGRSYFELHEDLAAAKQELERERKQRQEVLAQLAMTDKVKAEFGRTLRAIEDTFNIISDEKQIRIHELEAKLEAASLEAEQSRVQCGQQLMHLRDELEARRIEQAAALAELDLQRESTRHANNRAEDLRKQNRLLQDELDKCERELADLDESGDEGGERRSWRERERETISTACEAVPELGDQGEYTTSAEVCSGLIQVIDDLRRQAHEAKKQVGKLEKELRQLRA
eukprot:TRINITY_DN8168_c0_g1_i1.p1 TRINITY_DN8168_c0_g1~~TRINITY_DN8168_c0_g1_i1.p1  ORF type:complete len:679 (+),score=218.80 TRINITY_DN8168_c0_g1_i1:74-2038(+)